MNLAGRAVLLLLAALVLLVATGEKCNKKSTKSQNTGGGTQVQETTKVSAVKALEAARSQGRPVFLEFYADW